MSDIVKRFIRMHGFNLVSDGDLDAVFATGLLINALLKCGYSSILDGSVDFPRIREIKGKKVSGKILMELSREKGPIYVGENLLIDHHPDPPRVVLYRDDKVLLIRKFALNVSVAGLVGYIFSDVLDVPSELIDAVDSADYKNYILEQSKNIMRAFLISRNIPDKEIAEALLSRLNVEKYEDKPVINYFLEQARNNFVYGFIPLAIMGDNWSVIEEWIALESNRYEELIAPVAKRLYEKSKRRGGVSYVVYNYGDLRERTAVDEVLYTIQTESEIGVTIGVTTRGFLVRAASFRRDILLRKICRYMRLPYIDCSGTDEFVNMYFPKQHYDLGGVLRIVLGQFARIIKK